MTAAIEIVNLEKTYRKEWSGAAVTALKGISLTVEVGEAFGFIGPNGAGKSTTIKILTGTAKASSGSAKICGTSVDDPAARRSLGYVPENPYLYDYLTPLEILQMGLRLHRTEVTDVNAHCMEWLGRLDLAHVAGKSIRSFSKGMTQRVAIAQALAINPRLLILDEPLSGLDPIGRRDVVEILSDYKHNGGTLFFTSHVLHDVERLADRFGLINQGLLTAVRSPAELAGGEEMVVLRTLGDTAVDGMRPDTTGRWVAEIPRAELWDRLASLRAAGHTVLEIRPTLSLESAFMRAVGVA